MKKLMILLTLLAFCSAAEADDRWHYFSASNPFKSCEPLKQMYRDIGLPAQEYANMPDDMTPKVFASILQNMINTRGVVNISQYGTDYIFVETDYFDKQKSPRDLYFGVSIGYEVCETLRTKYIRLGLEKMK